MGFFNRKAEMKAAIEAEVKSILEDQGVEELTFDQFIAGGESSYGHVHVDPARAYHYYFSVASLGDSVNKISRAVASLVIGIKAPGGDVDYKHPLVQLLNHPGEGFSRAQLWAELAASYKLTNEAWLIARGDVSREPLAYTFIRPYNVSVNEAVDGLPASITTTGKRDNRTYCRREDLGKIRYVDAMGLNEIIPIIGMTGTDDSWRGESPLSQLFYELDQTKNGKRSNSSMLKNGMRTSGILTPKPSSAGPARGWGEKVVDDIQKRFRANNQGVGNSHNITILGEPAEIHGMATTNKDMDYIEMLKDNAREVYNHFDIPLPMVLDESMTLDNYTVAQKTFYNEAVFPTFEILAAGIIEGVGHRYKLEDDERLVFNDIEIRALRDARIEEMKKLNESQAVTKNEVREVGGYAVADGGDQILVNANMVPLSGEGNIKGLSGTGGDGDTN